MGVYLLSRRFESHIEDTFSGSGAKELLAAYHNNRYAAVAPGFKLKPGMIYSSVRAIAARINQNYDAWPSVELKKSYKSFVGKPIFVNHTNEDPSKARGVVVASRYLEKGADRYIETVMEVDAKRFPKLAHEIRTGGMDSVSMGVEAGYTICSICASKATDLFDMCNHIKFHKGEYLKNKKTGKKTLVYENCHKLGFFELSWVFDPADETAVVSRVIAANRTAKPVKEKGGGDELPDQPWFQPAHQLSEHETVTRWSPKSEAYQDHPPPNTVMRLKDPSATQIYDNADPAEQDYLDPLGFMPPYSPSKMEYRVPENRQPYTRTSWYKNAYGEQEAPEDIDTLRDESEDDTDDFHHWVESPPELRAPNFDKAERLDRAQEDQGLDQDRRAEDAEEYGVPGGQSQFRDEQEPDEPVMPINPPATRKSRRINQGVSMSRYFYADDDEDDGGGESQDDGASDVDSLLDEAEQDIESYEADGDGGDSDDQGEPEDDDSDEGPPEDEGEEPAEDDDSGDDFGDDSGDDSGGGDQPPWLQEGRRRPVADRNSRRNQRRTREGAAMTGSTLAQRGKVASRGRRHQADDSGYTDGGPYGRNDLGEQEDVHISDRFGEGVPGAEAVCAPSADEQVSNTPDNLVANRHGWRQSEFDPNHYQRLADVVSALPPAQRRAMADKMVGMLTADNQRFNWRTFFEAARVPVVKQGNRYFYAEDLDDPDKVDPGLSGTDVKDLKGSDFESLALDNVETQPKDASIHAFRVFDKWLAQATGRTARQHGNANFIRRAAASYVQNTGARLESLFPTLEYVLHAARTIEDTNARKANMQRYADESLEVAAPDGRVDVEAPVKNVTDEKAQSSQFDLSDFANNASDSLADPVLDVVDGNAGTWAPDKGKESSRKLATGVEALRCAEAHIAAMPNTYSEGDRFNLTARFETCRQAVVRERTRVLEAVVEDNKKSKTARKVTAASSRGTKGIPRNFGSGQRTAATQRLAANDPDTDSLMFFS